MSERGYPNPFGAHSIIRTDSGNPLYVIERKVGGYPHPRLLGGMSLVGGIGDLQRHRTFIDTARVEILEEMGNNPDLVSEVNQRLRFSGIYRCSVPCNHVQVPIKRDRYDYISAIFESVLPEELALRLGVAEGAVLSEVEGEICAYRELRLPELTFIFGFDQILQRCVDHRSGVQLRPHLPGSVVEQLDLDHEAPYGDLEPQIWELLRY